MPNSYCEFYVNISHNKLGNSQYSYDNLVQHCYLCFQVNVSIHCGGTYFKRNDLFEKRSEQCSVCYRQSRLNRAHLQITIAIAETIVATVISMSLFL